MTLELCGLALRFVVSGITTLAKIFLCCCLEQLPDTKAPQMTKLGKARHKSFINLGIDTATHSTRFLAPSLIASTARAASFTPLLAALSSMI